MSERKLDIDIEMLSKKIDFEQLQNRVRWLSELIRGTFEAVSASTKSHLKGFGKAIVFLEKALDQIGWDEYSSSIIEQALHHIKIRAEEANESMGDRRRARSQLEPQIAAYLLEEELKDNGYKPIGYYGALTLYHLGYMEIAPTGETAQREDDPAINRFWTYLQRGKELIDN